VSHRSRWPPALALCAAAALSACGGSHKQPRVIPRPDRVFAAAGTVEKGMASWYGPGYDGRRTSCGDRFDQDDLTAAHPTWACGTRVRVTLLSSGRSVVVRINDLFPGHKGRIVDLSRGAARVIGLLGPGTGEVRLEVVEQASTP
jgi:rare lipoprotein A (peptidoglycan hydrolase)